MPKVMRDIPIILFEKVQFILLGSQFQEEFAYYQPLSPINPELLPYSV
jgi:hypothetical protein